MTRRTAARPTALPIQHSHQQLKAATTSPGADSCLPSPSCNAATAPMALVKWQHTTTSRFVTIVKRLATFQGTQDGPSRTATACGVHSTTPPVCTPRHRPRSGSAALLLGRWHKPHNMTHNYRIASIWESLNGAAFSATRTHRGMGRLQANTTALRFAGTTLHDMCTHRNLITSAEGRESTRR
ncbi:hypothetical protein TRVL_08950 [Trypanosoma vivax]|nr:hypothetical protein TRVL_08950 [Trypanosoma vivax]